VYVVESMSLLFARSSPRVFVRRDGGMSRGWRGYIEKESVEADY